MIGSRDIDEEVIGAISDIGDIRPNEIRGLDTVDGGGAGGAEGGRRERPVAGGVEVSEDLGREEGSEGGTGGEVHTGERDGGDG